MAENINQKKIAAEAALPFIENGMTIGLGTGSTVYWLIMALGEKVKAGFHLSAVPTSRQTLELGEAQGINMITLDDAPVLDLTIDGADQASHDLDLIKGGGGALLQEKIVAFNSRQLIIVADESKYVEQLGAFALPVEVIPCGWKKTMAHIEEQFAVQPTPRLKGKELLITDHGHYIVDVPLQAIAQPAVVNERLKQIPGVVETGIFHGMAKVLVIGLADGSTRTFQRPV
jgi:ribose 5-phosphate isomerase A